MKSNREKLIRILQRHVINDAEIIMLKDILKTELKADIRVGLEDELDDLRKIHLILRNEEIILMDKIAL